MLNLRERGSPVAAAKTPPLQRPSAVAEGGILPPTIGAAVPDSSENPLVAAAMPICGAATPTHNRSYEKPCSFAFVTSKPSFFTPTSNQIFSPTFGSLNTSF